MSAAPRKERSDKWSREKIIQAVQTPLGFFVLVVLVVEVLLTSLAFSLAGIDRTLSIVGMLILMAVLVAVVTFLTYYRPEALMGAGLATSITERLERIESALHVLGQVTQHGSSAVLVAALLGLQDKVNGRPHCLAGGLTISPILLERLPETANGFYEMLRGEKHELKLAEHHLVDNFLRNLIRALPHGSCWLGITRLQSREAWRRKTANMAYFEFQKVAEQRTKKGEIIYQRLWNFDGDKQFQQMKETMHRQQDSGLQVRYALGSKIEDISIIWIPRNEMKKAVKIKDANAPIDELEERSDAFQALCAIKFGSVRAGRELDEMTICSPLTDEFKSLCQYFQENWKQAQELPPKSASPSRIHGEVST